MSYKLTLDFYGQLGPELYKTHLSSKKSEYCCESIRGKSGRKLGFTGSFQWTSAVMGISLMLVTYRISEGSSPFLGFDSGPITSVDYALSKEPNWILDMFGVDKFGKSTAKTIFKRTNSGRKYSGPVVIGIDSRKLKREDIHIKWDGTEISGDLSALTELRDCINASLRRKSWPMKQSGAASHYFGHSRVSVSALVSSSPTHCASSPCEVQLNDDPPSLAAISRVKCS